MTVKPASIAAAPPADPARAGSSSADRAQLFQQLAEDPRLADQMGQVFMLLAQGQQQAQQAQLTEVAERFADGHSALLQALRDSGQFRSWELELMEIGLATRRLGGIYRLLAGHYHQRARLQRQVWRGAFWPALLLVAGGCLLPLWAWQAGRLDLVFALGLMALPPALAAASGWVWSYLAILRWPPFRPLCRAEQRYLLFGSVALAVEAGVTLPQALKLAARRLPPGSVRSQASELAAAVARGERLSAALPASGLLHNLQLEAPAPGAGPAAAPAILARAARNARDRQSDWLGRWLPWLVLGWAPVLLALNGAALATV